MDSDEEAETDIEMPVASASASSSKASAATPQKKASAAVDLLATPPDSKRSTRFQVLSAKKTPMELDVEEEGPSTSTPVPQTRKKPSPFDSWKRTKAGDGGKGVTPQSRKRGSEEAVAAPVGKRTRSAVHGNGL